ncbi:MAG: hypothetical protein LQ342_002059 [Letrouitia transgressa]|nr:MAG: hypothetical protein LQ342_002059 [Letrouitia transgressa]
MAAIKPLVQIPLLKEDNFTTWLIDAEHAMEAADYLTPLISTSIKQRLREEHFDDGYALLTRVKELLLPLGETQFMRLTRELYTLKYDDFVKEGAKEYRTASVNLITHIKLLEERIDSTKVELTNDKRSLLALTMALWGETRYHSLIQIWNSTPDITFERARQMLLEEDQRSDKGLKIKGPDFAAKVKSERGKCWHFGKPGHREDQCWEKKKEQEGKDQKEVPKPKNISC